MSEKMREIFREYPREMEYLFDQFIAEMNDIADIILEDLPYFLGPVSGFFKTNYNKEITDDFRFIHLNRVLTGIMVNSDKPEGTTLHFAFHNSSIYRFLRELQYLREYSKYKELKIDSIEIVINSYGKNLINESNLDFSVEWNDIRHSIQVVHIFSGSIKAEFKLKYTELSILKEHTDIFNSVYKLFSVIQEQRESNGSNTNEELYVKIYDLDDSKVQVRKKLFERRDRESYIIY